MGAATSLSITDPKNKLLAVGLNLIGSLVNNMFDKYCEIQKHLAKASYHFEMIDFYNTLSYNLPNPPHAACDAGSSSFLCAIDRLTLCDMLTSNIKDFHVRFMISNHITALRDSLIKQLNNDHGEISHKIYEDVYGFYEDLGDILSENDDEDLNAEINYLIFNTLNVLKWAEIQCGIK